MTVMIDRPAWFHDQDYYPPEPLITKKYSVLLLRPESDGSTPAEDTMYFWVEAFSPGHAVKRAQTDAVLAYWDYDIWDTDWYLDEPEDPEAFAPLLVTEGYHYGLDWED